MQNSERLGRIVVRCRWWVVVLFSVVLATCMPFLSQVMTPFNSTGFMDDQAASTATQAFLDNHLQSHHDNQFVILYHSTKLKTSHPLFYEKIKYSLRGLDNFPVNHDKIYPDMNTDQISKDQHSAYVVINFKSEKPMTSELLMAFKQAIHDPSHMTVYVGGEALFAEGVNQQTQIDLYKADLIAAPVSMCVLILVFGSLVAAVVPMVLGGCCAVLILMVLFILGHCCSLSVFTLNIALLLGLCLNLDYALLMMNRFRLEYAAHGSLERAIGRTLATAGRAVFFSGVAVFISLSALLLFPINILFSIGVGGLVATCIAMMIALLLLPACFAILKDHLNYGSIEPFFLRLRQWFKGPETVTTPIWRHIALHVVGHPVRYFILSLTIVCTLGYPFFNVCFGISDFKVLPEHSESRQFFEAYQKQFHANELTPIVAVVSTQGSDILSSKHIGQIVDLVSDLEKIPGILRIDSIVTGDPPMTRAQYQSYYAHLTSKARRDNPLLRMSTGRHFTVLNMITTSKMHSKETKKLIRKLKQWSLPQGLSWRLTGTPVANLDVAERISTLFPYALLWVMGLTYLILFWVLRSLLLPLKAIFMNILSLVASYGVIVYVFQEGHGHVWLNFSPQGMVDISLLIIVFCAIFGFSMDYEVFLLTRIQEAYQKTHDNEASIVEGMTYSGRIITSAALIVMCICGSFMVADVLMVKEFGLGIAVAIFIDAFMIRTLLVPSTMVLLKSWNWYLPRCLKRFGKQV